MIHTIFTILILLSTWASASANNRVTLDYNGLTVGSLMKSEINNDCGCSFFTPPDKKGNGSEVLQWADGESAHMFIDKHLVSLNVETSMPYVSHLNQHVSLFLKGTGIEVTGKLSSSFVCPVSSESCEVTEFTGTLHVKKGKKSASVQVWGSCGC